MGDRYVKYIAATETMPATLQVIRDGRCTYIPLGEEIKEKTNDTPVKEHKRAHIFHNVLNGLAKSLIHEK